MTHPAQARAAAVREASGGEPTHDEHCCMSGGSRPHPLCKGCKLPACQPNAEATPERPVYAKVAHETGGAIRAAEHEAETAQEKLAKAREALLADGYFTPDQVSDDVRILFSCAVCIIRSGGDV